MAAIDYNALGTALKNVISAQMSGTGVKVMYNIEQPTESVPTVSIFIDRRDDPERQPIAAGQIQRYNIQFAIWCYCWALDNPAQAAIGRNSLVSSVENILLNNRTMSGAVLNGTLHGGQFMTQTMEDEGFEGMNYAAAGEILYRADVDAST